MTHLDDLYKEILLDHYRKPRHHGTLEVPPARSAHGFNPLCGDELTIYVDVRDGVVEDVTFEGRGCAISQAAASMMTGLLTDKSLDEVETTFERYRDMLGIETPDDEGHRFSAEGEPGSQLGDAEALQGVREFPSRIKCATLAWNTLNRAIAGEAEFTETDTD